MRYGIMLLACGLATALGEEPKADALKKVAPEGSGVTLLMPGEPKEISQKVAGATMKMMTVEKGRNGAYMMSHADLPIPANETPAEVQKRLDGSRDGSLGNMQGKLVDEKKITLGKYPGRDIRFEIPDKKGAGRMRIYLVGTKLIMVMAIGQEKFASTPEAVKFLESVELAPEK